MRRISFTILILPGDNPLWPPSAGITLIGQPLPVNLDEHVSLTTMSDRDIRTPEEQVGAQVKALRAKLGLTQAELADAMQGLGHSWMQTTVAKTEAADRPLRLNEVADLAKILGVRVPHLVSSRTDWEIGVIQGQLERWGVHALRLHAEIDELDRQVVAKTQAFEEAQKRIRELEDELAQINA
jgi:transcriptional regulator with XRE-family HTH domain